MTVFLLIVGFLLIGFSAPLLIIAIVMRRNSKASLSDRDIVVYCGTVLGILLGSILIAYYLPMIAKTC